MPKPFVSADVAAFISLNRGWSNRGLCFLRSSILCAFLVVVPALVFSQSADGPADDNYEVVPQFPRGAPTPPPAAPAANPAVRRALVIRPDGTVEQGDAMDEIQQAFPVDPLNPDAPRSEGIETPPPITAEATPVIAPGSTGTDGLPINPGRPISVRIVSPTGRQIIESRTVDVFFEIENYVLGTPENRGNRLHYILDNQSPQPVYDSIRPISFRNLGQGGHTVRLYAVQPDGRMIRDPQAFAMVYFFVGRKDFQNLIEEDAPFLTVNMPSGAQVATDDDGRVFFDYRMHNTTPGDGHEVRYQLGAYQGYLSEPGPVLWSNLPPGKHQLVAELLKPGRQPALGPANRVERAFSIERVMRALPLNGDSTDSDPDAVPTQTTL